MADEKIGNIFVYKDEDGKAVWEFEGKVQSDIPLDTEAQDFAGAINELKKLSEQGGGEDVWQPPSDWLEVPEPGDYSINFLYKARNKKDFWGNCGQAFFDVSRPEDDVSGIGEITVDWGDGTVETYGGSGKYWGGGSITHNYKENKMFVICAVCTAENCFLRQIGGSMDVFIIKLGDNIIVNNDELSGKSSSNQSAFKYLNCLHWAKFNGAGGLPRSDGFRNCYSLRRVDIKNPVEIIPPYTFYSCYTLKIFDFSKVKKIGDYALYLCVNLMSLSMPECTEIGKYGAAYSEILKSVSLPECTNIGEYGFYNCHSLEECFLPKCASIGTLGFNGNYNLSRIELPENCTFGNSVFGACNNFYPRPDGSTN